MKEFQVPNKVNQSAKKREKRKVKKEKEKELQAILDQRKAEQKQAQLREKYNMGIELSSMESDRKPLKKKVLPKKTIADAQGDWEVVDKKQQVFVEVSGDDNESLSD